MAAAILLGLALGWLNPDSNSLLLYLLPPGMFIYFLIYTPIDLRQRFNQIADQNIVIIWRLTSAGITVDKDDQKN